MEKYIITPEFFEDFEDILAGSDFETGTIVTQDEDGTLHLPENEENTAQRDPGDPVLPPPFRPPILP